MTSPQTSSNTYKAQNVVVNLTLQIFKLKEASAHKLGKA